MAVFIWISECECFLCQNLSDCEDSNYTEPGDYVSAEQKRTEGTRTYLFTTQSSWTFPTSKPIL